MRKGRWTVLAVCYYRKHLRPNSFRGRDWARLEGSLRDHAFGVLGFASALDRVQSRMLLHGLVSRSVTDHEQDSLATLYEIADTRLRSPRYTHGWPFSELLT